MNIVKPLTKYCLAICATTLISTIAVSAPGDLEKETSSYIKAYKSGDAQHEKAAMTELFWSGITDNRIYDVIEQNLMAEYKQEDAPIIEQNAWRAKALAISGDDRYKKTLETIINDPATNSKLVRHAEKAIANLETHKAWNNVINQGISNETEGSLQKIRVTNMLNSDSPELIRYGAKLIYRDYPNDTTLLDVAEKTLVREYQNTTDPTQAGKLIDALAWICKALGQSGDAKYKASLEMVIKQDEYSKLARYAKKALTAL